MARDLGFTTEEIMISVEDLKSGLDSGEITEVFACGTAAVVSPIGTIKSALGTWVVGDGNPGSTTMKIRETLVGIQEGRVEDKHGWVKRVK
jgi:branched-chain amino acid aminotransferase